MPPRLPLLLAAGALLALPAAASAETFCVPAQTGCDGGVQATLQDALAAGRGTVRLDATRLARGRSASRSCSRVAVAGPTGRCYGRAAARGNGTPRITPARRGNRGAAAV